MPSARAKITAATRDAPRHGAVGAFIETATAQARPAGEFPDVKPEHLGQQAALLRQTGTSQVVAASSRDCSPF